MFPNIYYALRITNHELDFRTAPLQEFTSKQNASIGALPPRGNEQKGRRRGGRLPFRKGLDKEMGMSGLGIEPKVESKMSSDYADFSAFDFLPLEILIVYSI